MRKAIFGLLLVSSCSKGLGKDFEGEITMQVKGASGAQTMVVKAKSDKLRFESSANGKPMVALFDPMKNKVTLLMDDQKAYMDMDFSSPSAPKPNVDAAKATAEKTGKSDKVAGVSCEEWRVGDPSGKHTEVCLADGLAFFNLAGVQSGWGGDDPFAKQLREKKQFPLRSIDFDAGGKETSRTEVTQIEKKKLDDALFEVPQGYAKLNLPK